MNNRVLNSWAGLVSIVWILGGYVLVLLIPERYRFFLEPFGLDLIFILAAWLGVGLLFAIADFRRGNLGARLCGIVGTVMFLHFAWTVWLSPLFYHAKAR